MNLQPIGLILRQIAKEKRFKNEELAKLKGVTAQAVSNAFARKSMRTSELEAWANILGVSADEVWQRAQSESTYNSLDSTSNGVNGAHQAGDEIESFLQEFKVRYDKILAEKDREIEYLRDQLRLANENLGKH